MGNFISALRIVKIKLMFYKYPKKVFFFQHFFVDYKVLICMCEVNEWVYFNVLSL